VIVVAGHAAVLAIENLAGGAGKGIPDALATSVQVGGSFNLVTGGGCTPQEVGWKSFHGLLLGSGKG
jgi:hypothetical protein